jgi:hypothetical protein
MTPTEAARNERNLRRRVYRLEGSHPARREDIA